MTEKNYKKTKNKTKSIAVLGLGLFGIGVVKTLASQNVEILAFDKSESHLQEVADIVTHAVCGDASDETILKSLELGNFDIVIIAITKDFESALVATMVAKEQGAKRIIVKAVGELQKKILLSIGVEEVVLPENEMGTRLAKKLIGTNVLEILGESKHYAIEEQYPLPEWLGKSIIDLHIRRNHDMTIIAVMRGENLNVPVSPNWVFEEGDVIVVLNKK
ncbi:MAG: potassium channel family protein [Lactovum sp.]